jgi:DNA polymerase III delta prime subunit
MEKNPLVDSAFAQRLKDAAEERSGHGDVSETAYEEEEIDNIISTDEGLDSDRFNVYQALCNMTAGEKIKLAHTGDRSVRNLLIKDNNRVVALSVLKNPKLTEQEVVRTISSTSISEEIIREIANSRKWMKCYNVKCAMAFNPHTPLSFSLKIIDYLREKELKQLAKSKGIPGALVNAASRKLKLKKR